MKRSLIAMTLSAITLLVLGQIVPPGASAQPVQEWAKLYDGPNHYADRFWDIAVDPTTGNVYVTGSSYNYYVIPDLLSDYATVAYDSNGTELWVRRYNGSANINDAATGIAIDPSAGNVYVTGMTTELVTLRDYTTIAYDSTGIEPELWVEKYDGPGQGGDTAWAIAVDPNTGNVYVTGGSGGTTTELDYATIAYDSGGNQLWVQRYDGPGHVVDVAHAIAVNPSTGNVYVTGQSLVSDEEYDYDYATVAYDSNGTELWVRRYSGPILHDVAWAIAVDPNTGNVYVTGNSDGVETYDDYATIAYDSGGNQLWVQRYNGPENHVDIPHAIVIDPCTGNVYVTGQSKGEGVDTGDDYATVAYDSNGTELWVRRYNGPDGLHDEARAIAVDRSTGTVYVTGGSNTGSTSAHQGDCVTVAYNIGGNELWVERYDGPFQNDETASAIAVDTCTHDIYITGRIFNENTRYTDGLTIKYGLDGPENQPPLADPGGPYLCLLNQPCPFDGSGSSDPTWDPLIYAWDFGDGSNSGTREFPSHTYNAAGIYNVCLTVNDGCGDSEEVCTSAVVYDQSAGFVTGNGWIDSPEGAYKPDPSLSGKANFGFISKYKKGATVPTGQTEFQFQTASLNFHSDSYDWLVVTGSNFAKFRGDGTINGGYDENGNAYKFMIWAGDDYTDTFRIRIWSEDNEGNELDVYDNEINQEISGGQIIIHVKKK
jgi:hypothetical protein